MAGPTPVSALIHAATMVTSGLYLVCRMSPVFAVAPTTMAVIAVTGALTALLAATIGCVQNEIKKVLAYSTVSQLGFMFAAAGCGAFAASFFHVYTHAFFKACLFLGAGSVMHAVGAHGDADIRRLGGLRKYLPKTHATFLLSCLAIAGVPPLSGFFSKDEILVGALSVGDYLPSGLGEAVFAVLILTATMTAFYMFRLYFLTFAGEYRGGPEHAHGEHGHGEPHESPDAITVPLVLLAGGAVVAGYVWVGLLHFQPWVDWLTPSLGSIHEGAQAEHKGAIEALIAGSAAALIGISLAYSWYGRAGVDTPARLAAAMPRLHRLVLDKWRVDELYDATLLAGSRGLGLLSAGLDKVVVDGLLAKASALCVQGVGFLSTRIQNGLVQSYAAVMVAGFLGVTYFFAIPHAEVELPKPPDGSEAELVAQPGLGYQFRWDFDSNGTFDTEYSAETRVTHTFTDAELEPGAVIVLEPGLYAAGLRQKRLSPGARFSFDAIDLGPGWQRSEDDATLPRVEVLREGVMLHVNGARVRVDDKLVPAGEKVQLARGEHADVGQARLTVARGARVTVQVKNAFGVERKSRVRFNLPHVVERPEVEILGVAEAAP
jgi:NADH-quinone oxidoreductase subunit L